MPKKATANGKELANNIDDRGRIVDPISLEAIDKNPGKSLVLDRYAFNIDTLKDVFKGVVDDRFNIINFNIADWDEFFIGIEVQNIFNNQGGPLRFININAEGVLDDLKQLYLAFGGGEYLSDTKYNTRSNDLGVIEPIVWGAALRKKRRSKKTKSKKPTKKTKKRRKRRKKSKMR
tara:strand:+ start:31 stop:558 length:528 start_codon:yes stop_codon:yes gene_type:complete